MTIHINHSTSTGNGVKPFVIHNRRFCRYAGRVSGAARRERTWERDNYICYYHALGVSQAELSRELGLHRNTIRNVINRHARAFMTLWGKLRSGVLGNARQFAHLVKNAVFRNAQRTLYNSGDRRGGEGVSKEGSSKIPNEAQLKDRAFRWRKLPRGISKRKKPIGRVYLAGML